MSFYTTVIISKLFILYISSVASATLVKTLPLKYFKYNIYLFLMLLAFTVIALEQRQRTSDMDNNKS